MSWLRESALSGPCPAILASSSGRFSSAIPAAVDGGSARHDAETQRGQGGASPGDAAAPRLGRDPDAICLKALRKEPHARYASAGAFADDLCRLRAGLPVAARHGGRAYRLFKRAQRHRVHLTVAAVAALVASAVVLVALRGVWPDGPGSRSPRFVEPPPRPTLSRIGELSAHFAESPNRPELGLELIDALLAVGRGDDAMGAACACVSFPILSARARASISPKLRQRSPSRSISAPLRRRAPPSMGLSATATLL